MPKGKLVKGGQRRYVVRKKLNRPHRVTGFRYVHLCHDNASSPCSEAIFKPNLFQNFKEFSSGHR